MQVSRNVSLWVLLPAVLSAAASPSLAVFSSGCFMLLSLPLFLFFKQAAHFRRCTEKVNTLQAVDQTKCSAYTYIHVC